MAFLLNAIFTLFLENLMLSTNYTGITVWSTVECAGWCSADKSCLMFFYNTESGQCQLRYTRHVLSLRTQLTRRPFSKCFVLLKDSCPIMKRYRLSRNPPLCYRISKEGLNHDDAMAVCNKDGGFLVRIDSQEKQDYFAQLHSEIPSLQEVWIDGSDKDDEDVWRFADGTLMNYSAWSSSNQPNNDRNCIQLNGNHSEWFHKNCNGTYKYVCELPIAKATFT